MMFGVLLQIIDTFSDSVMSVCLTKTEIIAGSVDGTVRTFDIRIGRYVTFRRTTIVIHCIFPRKEYNFLKPKFVIGSEKYLIILGSPSTVFLFQMIATVY